jgi:hypothetical protein
VKCLFCGGIIEEDAKYCQTCGKLQPSTDSLISARASTKSHGAGARPKGGMDRGLLVFMTLIGLVILGALGTAIFRGTTESPVTEGHSSGFCKDHPKAPACTTSVQSPHVSDAGTDNGMTQSAGLSASTKKSSEPVTPDPAVLKAVREEWIRNTQEGLYREGVEMKFQARGTTLYVKYVLAGEAFAFQFHETFLGQNGATLKALGFKRVELSNGENQWSWNLANY